MPFVLTLSCRFMIVAEAAHTSTIGCWHAWHHSSIHAGMKGILMSANILYMFSFYFLLALNICMYIHAPALSSNYRQTSFICPYQVYGETIEQLLSLCWITGTSPTVYECNTSPLLFVLLWYFRPSCSPMFALSSMCAPFVSVPTWCVLISSGILLTLYVK
jgi:hypothetical protein